MSNYNIHIKNYQILKDISLQFPTGITLITGPSNNGKSSIFKAFKQLVYNTSGTDFITHNQSKTTITLNYTNDSHPETNYSIVYSKSKTQGSYQINNDPPFSKLGSSQLDIIKDITHISKELNYNFWNQMDKPFLISLPSREQFDLLQQSPHTQVLQSILQQMIQDRKVYQNNITQFQSQLELIQSQNQQFQTQLQMLPKYTQLFNSINNLKDQKEFISKLQDILHQYQSIDITQLQSNLQKYQNIPSLSSLDSQFTKLHDIKLLFQQLLQTQLPINEIQNSISQYQTLLDQTHLFTQTYFKLCPLCNQPFHTDL